MKLVWWVLFSTRLKHGLLTLAKNASQALLICTARDDCWVSPGKIILQTKLFHPDDEILSMFSILMQRHQRWLGRVCHIGDGWIPEDKLFSELATGIRRIGRSALWHEDVCKSDLRASSMYSASLGVVASDCNKWRSTVNTVIYRAVLKKETTWDDQ